MARQSGKAQKTNVPAALIVSAGRLEEGRPADDPCVAGLLVVGPPACEVLHVGGGVQVEPLVVFGIPEQDATRVGTEGEQVADGGRFIAAQTLAVGQVVAFQVVCEAGGQRVATRRAAIDGLRGDQSLPYRLRCR